MIKGCLIRSWSWQRDSVEESKQTRGRKEECEMSGVWNKIIGPVLMAITGTYHYLLNDDTVTGSIWIVGAIIVLVLSDR